MDQLGEGREAARRALDRYRADADDRWREQASVRRLPEEEKDRLQAEIGELLVLLATPALNADGRTADDPKRRDDLDEALRMNRLAEKCYPEGQAPRALWAERGRLEALLGHKDEARRQYERADATPVRDDWDEYLLAREQAGSGRLADAAERLRAVAVKEPTNFAVQFLMGNCCLDGFIDRLGQETDAVGCYSACIALRPDFHGAYANRGRVRLRRGQYAEAEADLTRAIELRPNQGEYYVDRGQARDALGREQDALDDLDRAEELGSTAAMLYYQRMQVHRRLGHDMSARRDLDHLLRLTPTDEKGFVARGLARAADGAMKAALDDFTRAVELNPNSVPALQDQAAVLAEQLGRNRKALAPLDRLLELYPAFARRGAPGRGAGAAGDARRGRGRRPKGAGTQPRQRRGALPGRLRIRPVGARPRGRPDGGVPAFVPGAATGPGLGPAAQDDDLATLANRPAVQRPQADGGAAANGRGEIE